MKLPANLSPWAKHLQIFPEEISLTLGNYVQKISPFISPIKLNDEESDGEPNGFDGVSRRGIYERLLLSEFALADSFSDEFIRRAVMGEHLFLNPAKISPSAKRVSVALFDAGAMQIGSPRIAHLAAFIILARRAEAANAMFLWGVLQNEKQLIISDDTESSIKILLESRVPNEVCENDISAWREKLSEVDKFSDVWLIGSENLSQVADNKGFSYLFVDEVLDIDKSELELKIKSFSGVEKQVNLELPPPNFCTRLLRNPFEIPSPISTKLGKIDGNVTNFFFDATGTKLFAKLDSNTISSFSVHNLNSIQHIQPKYYKSVASMPYIAIGRLNKAVAVASKFDAKTIRFNFIKYGYKQTEGLYQSENLDFSFPDTEKGLLQLYSIRPRNFHYNETAFLDANKNLFLLNSTGKNDHTLSNVVGRARISATNVLAVAQTDYEFMYVGCEDGNEYHYLISVSDKIERKSLSGKRLNQAFFGRGDNGKKVLAYDDASGNWNILESNNQIRIMPQPKGEVVGVYQDSRFAPNAGLFELLEDRKTLEFTWAYGRRKLILKSNEEILKIEFNQRSPILAYQTESELVIFSLTHQTAIGRYSK
ncbi:MAG: hypothetical protein MUC29_03115 [Pyrinomonadaceae bacterium]|jgi:hypothetical protein|nr:hypothetical protein [Pyrinomonadaceae bacterium]